jgi:hypothetical protein
MLGRCLSVVEDPNHLPVPPPVMTPTSPSTSKIFDGWSGWMVCGTIKGSGRNRDSPDEKLAIFKVMKTQEEQELSKRDDKESRILRASHSRVRNALKWVLEGAPSGRDLPWCCFIDGTEYSNPIIWG